MLFHFQKIREPRMSSKHSYCMWSSFTNVFEYIHSCKSLLWAVRKKINVDIYVKHELFVWYVSLKVFTLQFENIGNQVLQPQWGMYLSCRTALWYVKYFLPVFLPSLENWGQQKDDKGPLTSHTLANVIYYTYII